MAVNILQSLIRVCELSNKKMEKGRIKGYLTGLVLGKDEEIRAEMSRLSRLIESEERMVGALTLSTVSQSTKVLEDVKNSLNEIKTEHSSLSLHIRGMSIRRLNSRKISHAELLTKLILLPSGGSGNSKDERTCKSIGKFLNSSHMYQEIYDSVSRKRIPNTGDWIREDPIFQAWIRKERSILWLYGGPGAGKSFIFSNVIQYLTQLFPRRVGDYQNTSVVYFFCKDFDPELRSFNQVLKSCAYQLCQNDPVYAKYCLDVFEMNGEIRTMEAIWRRLFVDFFQKADLKNNAILLIDGVDEAFENECREFLELIRDVRDTTLRVQVMIVGRPVLNRDINDVLDKEVLTLSVSKDKTSHDLEKYVHEKIRRVRIFKLVSQNFRKEAAKMLIEGADGMFLWIDLMIKEASEMQKTEQIRRTLLSPPKGLPNIIRHVLKRFASTLQKDLIMDLNELLAWVTCAPRQLTLRELDDIVKLRSLDEEGFIDLEGASLRKMSWTSLVY